MSIECTRMSAAKFVSTVAGPSRSICFTCRGLPLPLYQNGLQKRTFASGKTSSTPGPSSIPHSTSRKSGFYIPISLLVLLPTIYYLYPSSSPSLSPQVYSEHPISSSTLLGPQHKLISIPVDSSNISLFGDQAVDRQGAVIPQNTIVIQHVMVKNPDLQIERPYTPINDVEHNGQIDLIVKKVKGGEVGR